MRIPALLSLLLLVPTLQAAPPALSLEVGAPSVEDGDLFVTPSTPLSVVGGAGVRYYRIDAGDATKQTGPFTLGTPEGPREVTFWAVQGGETGPETTVALVVDGSPPSTQVALDGDSCNGWFRSAATLTASASDALVGVASTRIDAGDGEREYDGPLTLEREGRLDVRYRSVDRLGNEEAPATLPVALDLSDPTTAVRVSGSHWWGPDRLYVAFSHEIHLDPTDSGSGVAFTLYRVDEGDEYVWGGARIRFRGADSAHSIDFATEDHACRREARVHVPVFLDVTRPAISFLAPLSPAEQLFQAFETVLPGLGFYSASWLEAVRATGHSELSEDARGVATLCQGLAAAEARGPCLGASDEMSRALSPSGVTSLAPVAGVVDVQVKARDPIRGGGASGVAEVRFHVDGVHRATVKEAPYTWSWDTRGEPGRHLLTATVFDRVGYSASVERSILVAPAP